MPEYFRSFEDHPQELNFIFADLRPGPSHSFYDKNEKIRQANLELRRGTPVTQPKKRTTKIRFNEDVTYNEEDDDEADYLFDTEATSKVMDADEGKSSATKVLLVTVPTGFQREQSEEAPSDGSDSDDQDPTNPPGASFSVEVDAAGEEGRDRDAVQADPQEDELEGRDEGEDSSRQDTFDSTDTVLCRSEALDLSDWFSRSMQMEDGEGDVDNKDEEADSKAEEPGFDLQEEVPGAEDRRPSTAFSVRLQRKPPPLEEERAAGRGGEAARPSTAPVRRPCCARGQPPRLPSYNGLRSEYGLSEEQLRERERKKEEVVRALKQEKEMRYLEQRRKRRENEMTFNSWLIRKKREAEAKALRRLRQSSYCFRTVPAPTAHLDKIGILRRKMLRKESTCFLLNEIFRNAKPHEQKTYRIYLGLRTE